MDRQVSEHPGGRGGEASDIRPVRRVPRRDHASHRGRDSRMGRGRGRTAWRRQAAGRGKGGLGGDRAGGGRPHGPDPQGRRGDQARDERRGPDRSEGRPPRDGQGAGLDDSQHQGRGIPWQDGRLARPHVRSRRRGRVRQRCGRTRRGDGPWRSSGVKTLRRRGAPRLGPVLRGGDDLFRRREASRRGGRLRQFDHVAKLAQDRTRGDEGLHRRGGRAHRAALGRAAVQGWAA